MGLLKEGKPRFVQVESWICLCLNYVNRGTGMLCSSRFTSFHFIFGYCSSVGHTKFHVVAFSFRGVRICCYAVSFFSFNFSVSLPSLCESIYFAEIPSRNPALLHYYSCCLTLCFLPRASCSATCDVQKHIF